MENVVNMGWIDMLLMAGIGFGVVFCVLVLLIFIMNPLRICVRRENSR